MKKRVLSALITVFVVSSFIVTPALASPVSEGTDETEAATTDVAGDASQQPDANATGTGMTEAAVNSQLVSLLVQFDALQKDMGNQQVKLDEATEALTQAQATEQKQREDMKLRIKYMYEAGDSTFLEALLSAGNYADMVNKAEYVQDIHEYDRKKLNEYIKTTEETAEKKAQLESEQSEMQGMARDFENQKASLEGTLNTLRTQVPDFDVQLAAAEEQASQQFTQLSTETQSIVASIASGNSGTAQGADQSTNASNGGGQASAGTAASGNGNAGTASGNTNTGNTTSTPSTPAPSAPAPSAPEPSAPAPSTPSSSGGGSSASTSNSGVGQQIANTGCGYVGVLQYVYAGNSLVSGTDCSGFTQLIFRSYGISIPRTAEDQWAGWGRTVSYAEALPGDLVCYSGHVGIYIGGGQLVHASNERDGVKISNIGYRQWLGFKRYW